MSQTVRNCCNQFRNNKDDREQRFVKINKDLSGDLSTDEALGICWNVADDTFSFKIKLDRTSLTKRTMLSMISSIYDPLGFAAPFVLEGRILQGLCNQNLACDMEVNDDVKNEWNKFITRLKYVDELYVRRCIRPDNFWEISDISDIIFLMHQSRAMGSAAISGWWMKKDKFIVVCYWESQE